MRLVATATLVAVAVAVMARGVAAADLCDSCLCVPPGPNPKQAFCRSRTDKVFSSTTSEASRSLELIYIHGMDRVALGPVALATNGPVDLVIDACANVTLADDALTNVRTLLVSDAREVTVGRLPAASLWSVQLVNIGRLTVALASLPARYALSISHVGALDLLPPPTLELAVPLCDSNLDLTLFLYDSTVGPVPAGGLSVCGGHVTIHGNRFDSVAEDGFLVSTEGSVAVVDNHFTRVAKQSFNLTAPQIHLTGNSFATLPAGALRAVSTLSDTFFTNNTVEDADLGGVLLDMGWDMVVEENRFQCDCASKRTSILDPKEDMLYLTNSSYDKLHNIFLNNFCQMDCSVSLKDFSVALVGNRVCLTNSTALEQEALCPILTEQSELETESESWSSLSPLPPLPSTTTDSTTFSPSGTLVSAASRPEFLVPLAIVLLTLVVSSICIGCRELNAFRFTFIPNRDAVQKPIELVR